MIDPCDSTLGYFASAVQKIKTERLTTVQVAYLSAASLFIMKEWNGRLTV